MTNFNEKSVLITGGSRGLGKALARRLAAEGAKVVVVARHKNELDETVREINGSGGTAFGVVADVGDKESIYPIVGQAAALAERFDIPASTMQAVRRTRASGGRVIAVGTSVVRALESSDFGLSGVTTLKLGPGYRPKNVDGWLTGTHDVSESHYQLLQAFLPDERLARVSRHLEGAGYLTHECGDLCLVLSG